MGGSREITDLLHQLSGGDQRVYDRLLPLVYGDLRSLARRYMSRERAGHTLQPTALVHEAFLRLRGGRQLDCRDRSHFLAIAAQAMRRILVDHARARHRQKREGSVLGLPGAGVTHPASSLTFDLLDLDRALVRLASTEPRKAKVVEMLYFAGVTAAEAAEALGVTSRTVERDWRFSRAWLVRELSD